MKICELTASQARVLLSESPCEPMKPINQATLPEMSVLGWPTAAMAEDAAGREHAVLAVNFAADDPAAPVLAGLPALAAEKAAAAAKALAEFIGAETVLVLAPEGLETGIEGARVIRTPSNPVLREESAFYHMLDTGELRSAPLEKDFPSQGYKGLPTLAVDAETLLGIYAAALPGYEATRLMTITAQGETLLAEVREGASVGAVLSELGLETKKPVLIGGVTGVFCADPGSVTVTRTGGTGSVQVFSDKECMADTAAKLLNKAMELSCEKCVLCREGTWHLAGIFSSITEGKAKKEDLDMVLDIGPLIHIGAFCSFGQGMAQAAVSCVQTCREELDTHIIRKKCPAGVCSAFSKKTYCIDPTLCTGCGDCEDECDDMAITGKKKFIYMIDKDMCSGCGKCVSACDEDAILVNDGSIKLPKKLTKVGKFK